nr:MAG: hypothetical protein [Guangxi cysto-like virus 2]
MSIYIVPHVGDFDKISEISKRARVEVATVNTVREFILATHGKPIMIAAVSSRDLMILARYASTLLDEMPTVVISAPGLIYEGGWSTHATAFPPIDWTELEGKLSKSGTLATNPDDLEAVTRGRGTGYHDDVLDSFDEEATE